MNPRHLTGQSELEREPDDFYKTPEHATQALLERESFEGLIWEPACGDGAIARLLPSACTMATDLHDRGYGHAGVDFLKEHRACDHIITNPPYKLAQEFLCHALECAEHKVALLLKLNFLEGQKRYPLFQIRPPATLYVFSKRLSFDRGHTPNAGRGLLAYAWFVWHKSVHRDPQIRWIP